MVHMDRRMQGASSNTAAAFDGAMVGMNNINMHQHQHQQQQQQLSSEASAYDRRQQPTAQPLDHADSSSAEPNYGRRRVNWFNENAGKVSDNFFLGGSGVPSRPSGRRADLASAPTGLHDNDFRNASGAAGQPTRGRAESARQRIGQQQAPPQDAPRSHNNVRPYENDSLSSFASAGKVNGIDFPQAYARDAGAHRDIGGNLMLDRYTAADRLQEQASNAFIARAAGLVNRGNALQSIQRNGQDSSSSSSNKNGGGGFSLGNGGDDGASMWQRSNAQYGMHVAKPQHEQGSEPGQKRAGHVRNDSLPHMIRAGAEQRSDAAAAAAGGGSSGFNPGNALKYNPYEHFAIKNAQADGHSVLATAAKNDRRLGNRLW